MWLDSRTAVFFLDEVHNPPARLECLSPQDEDKGPHQQLLRKQVEGYLALNSRLQHRSRSRVSAPLFPRQPPPHGRPALVVQVWLAHASLQGALNGLGQLTSLRPPAARMHAMALANPENG